MHFFRKWNILRGIEGGCNIGDRMSLGSFVINLHTVVFVLFGGQYGQIFELENSFVKLDHIFV